MSQLDDLLQRSRAPGQFVERRRFSLSRDKAIEKLREFSLRNPRQYVLELVQSAVFAGATYIAIDVDHEHMLLAWVGTRPLQAHELESIFDFLFADRGAQDTRHLSQLAIGLNAVLQRKPKVLRIESGDGTLDGTTRLDLDRKGDGVLGTPQDPLAGTYILAEFSAAWLKRFQGDSWTPEEGLVESECRYSPVPILLNGRAPFGWKASRSIGWFGTEAHQAFDDGQRRGVVALPGDDLRTANAGLQLIVGGVRITTAPIPELGLLPAAPGGEARGLVGVVCDDTLRKTADQSDVVRDARFAAMLHAVQPHATQLLRRVAGRGYEPPRLPALSSLETETAEPVPDPVPQLTPRPGLSLDGLRALEPGTPCFFVTPQDADGLSRAADPARFEHPVLVLTPGQMETLDHQAPDLAVHRLNSPADVDFVRRALEQRRRTREATLRMGGPWPGTLHLKLTLDGPPPLWSDPLDGDLPVRIVADGVTRWCGAEPIGIPGLSASLTLDREAPSPPDQLVSDITDRVLREAWRLLPPTVEVVERAAVQRFAAGVLAAHARPHIVRGDEGLRLVVHLPAGWGPQAEQLLDLPLAPTSTGPLTLRRLAAMQGTSEAVTLLHPGDLARLEALEERLGFGHLRAPVFDGMVAVVAQTGDQWQWWTGRQWARSGPDQIIGLCLTFGSIPPERVPEGWRLGEAPAPLLVRLLRDSATPDPSLQLAELVLLDRHLGHLLDTGRWSELVPEGVRSERVHAMLRLARMQVSGVLGRLREAPVLQLASNGAWVAPESALVWPDFSVSARHGPALDESRTALVSLDELVALEAGLDAQVPLRFDDPPEVWASLAEPDSGTWLVRHEVRVPGLRGWLGLRLPFDGTSGVFLQGTNSLLALTELDRRVPVHGLLWLTGGQLRPTAQQLDLLQLARQQLYQDLAGMIGRSLDAARALACSRYAMAYTHSAWHDSGGRLGGTAAHLADHVSVPDAAGAAWGSLRRWLEAPESARPALPATRRSAMARVVAEQSADAVAQVEDLVVRATRRLQAAASGTLNATAIQIHPEWFDGKGALVELHRAWSDAATAALQLNLGHPLTHRAESGDPVAFELVLLEATRRLAEWGDRFGQPVNLLEVQRVLVAQRLS